MTYLWIWRHLPGPLYARILTALSFLLAFIVVLFSFIFPNLPLGSAGESVIEPDYPGATP